MGEARGAEERERRWQPFLCGFGVWGVWSDFSFSCFIYYLYKYIRVLGFGFWDCDLCFVFCVLCFVFGFWGFGFWVLGFGFWVLGSGSWVIGLWVEGGLAAFWGEGFRIWGTSGEEVLAVPVFGVHERSQHLQGCDFFDFCFIWGFRSACHSVFRVHERSEHLSGGRVQGLSLRVEDLESRIEV